MSSQSKLPYVVSALHETRRASDVTRPDTVSVLERDAYTISSTRTPTPSETVEKSSCSVETTASSAINHCSPGLSTFRLFMAHVGAALALFLATTDATIVSTSLPTIASQFGALQSQYTWVGVAYMLTQTAFQPLYGRISDLVGRKMVLYSSMSIFAIGSLLCGAAQSIEWLIAARALAGVGGGGIVSSVWVITAEIVEIQNRAKWSQALSITWSCSAIAGPLLGGLFSGDHNSSILSWRWGFYINLPICLVAFVVLVCSLHNVTLVQSHDASWKMLLERFDFGGLVLFMGGSSCIVIGFSFASEVGWTAVSTLVLIITGFLVLIAGGFYEKYTSRECLFPATTFKNVTTVAILVITFLHNFTFNAGTFYLALYYQAANGSSPLHAGIKMLPYSLGSSLASMPAAWFMGYWQARTRNTSGQNLTISIGLLISTLGFGLLNLLNETSRISSQIIFPLIAGIGLGMLFHAPYQVFAKALKPQELATGTSAFFLVRFTGATVGLAVAGAIFYGQALGNMPTDVPSNIIGSSIDYEALRSLEPISLRVEVLKVISSAIQTVWTVCSPFLGIAFLISLVLRNTPIQEPTSKSATQNPMTKHASSMSEKV